MWTNKKKVNTVERIKWMPCFVSSRSRLLACSMFAHTHTHSRNKCKWFIKINRLLSCCRWLFPLNEKFNGGKVGANETLYPPDVKQFDTTGRRVSVSWRRKRSLAAPTSCIQSPLKSINRELEDDDLAFKWRRPSPNGMNKCAQVHWKFNLIGAQTLRGNAPIRIVFSSCGRNTEYRNSECNLPMAF